MYANIPEQDREGRALISSDQCVVGGAYFFIRGCLEIPVRGSNEVFTAQQEGISRRESMELAAALLHVQGFWSRSLQ